MVFMGMRTEQQFYRAQIDVVSERLVRQIWRKINQAFFGEMNRAVRADIPPAVRPGIVAIVAAAPGPRI